MRFLRCTAWLLGLVACMASTVAGAGAQAPPAGATIKMTHCPQFTAAKWTHSGNGMTSGNTYNLILTNETDCAQATTWAQKLTKGGTTGEIPYAVSGGPPGYTCRIAPDGHGGAIGGACRKKDSSGNLISAFDWVTPND